VTKKILENAKFKFEDATELDGYDELKPEDQARIVKAWADGHVAEEDIPESAKKSASGDEDEDEEKPKKAAKKAPAKKKAAEGSDDEAVEKPKKARATKAKVCHYYTILQLPILKILSRIEGCSCQ